MPNWAIGSVSVSGDIEDIEEFCKLFIFYEDVGNKTGKYFARSFIHQDWKDFHEKYIKGNKDNNVLFSVDFAWSGHSCLVEGYPDEIKECVTLEWACKKYNVSVQIDTEESGMAFEECITCDKEGNLSEECLDMPSYKCKGCGNEQTEPSGCCLEDLECWECGESKGFEVIE